MPKSVASSIFIYIMIPRQDFVNCECRPRCRDALPWACVSLMRHSSAAGLLIRYTAWRGGRHGIRCRYAKRSFGRLENRSIGALCGKQTRESRYTPAPRYKESRNLVRKVIIAAVVILNMYKVSKSFSSQLIPRVESGKRDIQKITCRKPVLGCVEMRQFTPK